MTRRLIVVLLASGLIAACDRPAVPSSPPEAARGEPLFVDGSDASSFDFTHQNGMAGRFHDAEIFGPGVALVDYDNDDDLDIFIVQGKVGAKARLYRNDGGPTPAAGPRFADVTDASGIDAAGYGMGVTTGDINNDGWVDLYVTNAGPNQMFLNNGDGTFADVTARSGTGDPGWSVSASFVDFDRDGWLDLYVANYVAWSPSTDANCFNQRGAPDYCSPTQYRPQPDRLYRNRGTGAFQDVTETALRGGQSGRGLGVATSDFNADGWPDIYVANDGEENYLWLNQRDGTFVNGALLAGVALNGNGRTEASMGLDAGDFDNDGDEDLFITNWAGETNTLYAQITPGVFDDRTAASGLGPPSIPFTGFGTAWFDFDNDRALDLFVANGAVITNEALLRSKDPFPLHEPDHLYRNLGDGRFEEISARAGAAFALPEVGRGTALGDIDNDGDTDIVVGNNNGRARLLINVAGNQNGWVGLTLIDRHGHRAGARVTVTTPDGATLLRRSRSDGSYASAHDPRLLIGLGPSAAAPHVRVTWPGGQSEEWGPVPLRQWTTLKEGSGR